MYALVTRETQDRGSPALSPSVSGSADFWVPSVDCRSEQCSKHRKYDPDASNTSQLQSDQTFKM